MFDGLYQESRRRGTVPPELLSLNCFSGGGIEEVLVAAENDGLVIWLLERDLSQQQAFIYAPFALE